MYCLRGTVVWKLKLRSVWPPFFEIHGGNHQGCGSGRKSRSTNNTAQRLSVWQTLTGNWHILVEVRVCTEAMARGSTSVCQTLRASACLFWVFFFNFYFINTNYSCQIPPLNLKIFSVGTFTVSHLRAVIRLFAQPPFTGWQKLDVKYLCSSLMREKGSCLFSTSGFYFCNANLFDSWKWLFSFFTCVYCGRLHFAWNCVTHWLLSTICAHQYSSCIHSKPLTTPFSCSCPLSFQTLGAQWPRSIQFVFFPL